MEFIVSWLLFLRKNINTPHVNWNSEKSRGTREQMIYLFKIVSEAIITWSVLPALKREIWFPDKTK